MENHDRPMTVAELVQHLKTLDQNASVMLACQDSYYDGPLRPECISTGTAFHIAPHKYTVTRKEAEEMRSIARTYDAPGGWLPGNDGDFDEGNVVEKRPCVVIKT